MKKLETYLVEKFKISKDIKDNDTYYVFCPDDAWVEIYNLPKKYFVTSLKSKLKNSYDWNIYVFTKDDLEDMYREHPNNFPDINIRLFKKSLIDKIDDLKSGKIKFDTFPAYCEEGSPFIDVHEIISNKKDIKTNI